MRHWIAQHPVLALTQIVALYAAAIAELQGRHLVSDGVMAWLGYGGVILSLIGGVITHTAVTPASSPVSTPPAATPALSSSTSAVDTPTLSLPATVVASPSTGDGAAGSSVAVP